MTIDTHEVCHLFGVTPTHQTLLAGVQGVWQLGILMFLRVRLQQAQSII